MKDYNNPKVCAKVMQEMDDAIRRDKKLERQMDNSFLYPNED